MSWMLRSACRLASKMESELRQDELRLPLLKGLASIVACVRVPDSIWSALTIFFEPFCSIIILSYLFKCFN